MKAIVACESSGEVREALRAMGVDAYSCDILPADDGSPYHLQGDVLQFLDRGWDLMIAHPPCTYLASSGLHWNKRVPGREEKTLEALEFVRALMAADIPYIAIENPVGRISTAIDARDYGFSTAKASQYIQPHQFGHDASKRTGLWLKGLPELQHTQVVAPRMVEGKPRWANQTDSGQNKLGPSEDRWKERSKTFTGIAQAMASQWVPHIRNNMKEAA
ncbi:MULTISPECIES: hypothetical protein [unclassified Thioalkalivibrio]|uniref:hypothetical protein n=1 Tax=unclassified Thioalkalivibrio TaxID=2621013 RepID=UPI0003799D62|nr:MULTISPECIES: hypothetical protein [unclassified Thioalkalivibrio]